jgi:hypothetical protein
MPRPHGRRGLLRTLGGLLLAPLVAAPPLDASSSPDADRDRRLSGGTRQTDPFLGEILLVPYNFAPRGWVFCEGQRLPIRAYQALYSLLGTTACHHLRATPPSWAQPPLAPEARSPRPSDAGDH